MSILIHALVALAYLGLTLWAWLGAWRPAPRVVPSASGLGGLAANAAGQGALAHGPGNDGRELPAAQRLVLLVTWVAHGTALFGSLFERDGLRLGFAFALSATMWLAVAIYWVESLYVRLASMRVLILPLAALCTLLPVWFPGALMPAQSGNRAFELHLIVAIAAYGLLTLAALHALLMAALDRWLHGAAAGGAGGAGSAPGMGMMPGMTAGSADSAWSKACQAVLGQLPPLMTMERLLFRTLAAGFVLLTLTLISGVIFSEELFGRPVRFEHKTVFGFLSWCIFAALLLGRRYRGWRGRRALRWTLAGFFTMFLAYVGSRFVLEVILHRI